MQWRPQCVRRGGHTLTCCTHIFLLIARAQSHLHMFMRVHKHAWFELKSCQKGVRCTCITPLHLAFSISCFTCLCCSCTPTSTCPFSPQSYFPVLKAQDMPLRTCIEKFGYLSKLDGNTGSQEVRQDHFCGQ